jgi:hypothetical protein
LDRKSGAEWALDDIITDFVCWFFHFVLS